MDRHNPISKKNSKKEVSKIFNSNLDAGNLS